MSDLLQRIRELKTPAKNQRDFKRYDRAAALSKQAIDLAFREYETTDVPEWHAALASELSDCFGILGGIERRWALDPRYDATHRSMHLEQSVNAYDQGYRYESDPSVGNTSNSTYNRLNRLLVRLLLDPVRLSVNGNTADPEAGDTLNVRAELEAVAADIEAQGTDSIWAAADLSLLNVLLGRQDAASAYAGFEKKSPPDFACQSALDAIAPLAAIDLPTAGELKSAERRLTALRDRLHTR